MKTLNIGSGKYKDNNGEWSTLPCLKGDKGENGESAYQLAVRLGTFTGTEEEYNEQFSEIVRKTNAAEKSIKEAENKIQENIKNIGSLSKDLKTKINIPQENPEIGKVLKVKSINEDGTFVCEWADSASDLDVQIDGKSIVQNGVAEIPLAKNGSKGIVKLGATWLTALELISDGSEMVLGVHKADPANIDTRYPHNCGVVVPSNLDYAVKAAMCDGKGTAWTAEEQAAARERMGLNATLISKIVIEEEVSVIKLFNDQEHPLREYFIYMVSPIATAASAYIQRVLVNADKNNKIFGKTIIMYNIAATDTATTAYARGCLENNHEIVNFIVTKYNTGNAQLSVNSEGQYKENLEKAIGFSELNIAATNDTKIPIGTTIELYGMRW